ncbi:MAG: hypothetical protein ACJ8BW_40830 [Ktedonobacteraceae bacterium]
MYSCREVAGDSVISKKECASRQLIPYLWLLIMGKEKAMGLKTSMAANKEEEREGQLAFG